MDFFAHQDRAKASTFKLMVLYVLAVVGVVISLNLVALLLTNVNRGQELREDGTVVEAPLRIVPEAHLLTTLGALAIIGLAGLYRKATIGSDGANVAEMLGGQLVDPATRDPEERKLMNIVEEMTIASGVPMPRVYIMQNEEGINAFAAGTRLDNAVVAVTRGCIHELNRDELQGVVAHEFSHILNGDMRLNLRMIALNFGIMAIGVIGYYILRMSPRMSGGKKEGAAAVAAIFVIGLGMMIIGFVGLFFGRILQASVSRQREFLADASAVQFTRNPSGIANALKKIGGLSSKIHDTNASEVAHMFFAPGIRSLFSTHPPIEARIRAIEPNWDGKLIASPTSQPGLGHNVGPRPDFAGMADANAAGFSSALPPPMTRIPLNADNVVNAAGLTRPPAIEHADAVMAKIPAPLHEAATDPYLARSLVLALLFDSDPAQRQIQTMELSGQRSALAREAIDMSSFIISIDRMLRLPLLDLAMPALRTLTPTQIAELKKLAELMASVDRKLSLFELALLKILEQIWHQSTNSGQPPAVYRALTAVAEPVRILFSALAQASDSPAWPDAYARGMDRLGLTRGEPTSANIRANTVDVARAIDTLRLSTPQIKKRIIDAAAHLVVEDNTVTLSEAELLRATSAALDVPLPPIYDR
ncbi:MAG TPA: M48 family metallopeptidase [Tepidisphaeraceae bacterium]|nr:M48 family metallopeptidase [Tepidisphaeraceae bacterium]